ncbi:TPA: hypothetical protein DDW35_05025 [Candidatus Sumerlaeota bacterium]|nr:hypothetical protein [Candidatus Sumerlaeota bacterium]
MRRHDAALLLRDMSRDFSFASQSFLLRETTNPHQATAHDMSCNGKAVSCHRTPKRPFRDFETLLKNMPPCN